MANAAAIMTGRAAPAGIYLTEDLLEEFLEDLHRRNRTAETLDAYRRNLARLKAFLGKDRPIQEDTLEEFRASLRARGYAERTINSTLSTVNSLLDYCGKRDWQARPAPVTRVDLPEITRGEYIRLLQTAIVQGKKRAYLLTKLFCVTGLSLQALPTVTVEAVRDGTLAIPDEGAGGLRRLPSFFREELLSYAQREGVTGGPIFVTREKRPLNRSSVNTILVSLAEPAHVARGKCNPRSLQRLCSHTRQELRDNMEDLMMQTHLHLLESEQALSGWPE